MSDLIRCTSCRGSKKVAKLGGMIGDCNACKATGFIKVADKPKPIVIKEPESTHEIIEQVSEIVLPVIAEPVEATKEDIKAVAKAVKPTEPTKMIKQKRTYKRKTA